MTGRTPSSRSGLPPVSAQPAAPASSGRSGASSGGSGGAATGRGRVVQRPRQAARPQARQAARPAAPARARQGEPGARPGVPGSRPPGWRTAALRSTVSRSSAERFAARVRRRRRRRAAVTGSAMALGLVLGWLLFGSSLLAVRRIEVRGVHRVPAAAVREAVRFEIGHPMALVSPDAAAAHASAVPLVRSVRVVRSWPSTLVVEVVEREPIAAVPAAGGRLALVDGDGVVVETVAAAPAGLPVLQVDVATAGPAALRAARAVSDGLPQPVRDQVRSIGAASPDGVQLVLTDRSTVQWGSADRSADKAQALLAVHPKPGERPTVIDVTAPDAPAVHR